MKDLSISRRILFMNLASIVALLIVGFVGLSLANMASESAKRISDSALTRIQTLSTARQAFMETRVSMYALIFNSDDAALDAGEKTLKGNAEAIDKWLRKYEELISNDQDKRLYETDVATVKAFLNSYNAKVLAKLRAYAATEASNNLNSDVGPLGNKALQAFDDHMEFNAKLAKIAADEVATKTLRGKIAALATILGGLATVSLLGWFLLKSIKSSLHQIRKMVGQVESDLDFTLRVDVHRHDEIGQTTSALNRLLEKLQSNMQEIAESAQSVASAAKRMTFSSERSAQASRIQTEAAADMAATVEEMAVSISHVADRAQEANVVSNESGLLANTGEKVIGQTVSDIQEIASTVHQAEELIRGLEAKSLQISKVVLVIKEVAEQTNLLALNAAIESARAGEHGRGFAVVADEVRKLAERTANSTKEIAGTIDAMRICAQDAVVSMDGVVSRVNRGVERARETNTSITRIGKQSKTTVGMVEEIAAAIHEQGSATNNIATQVERIARMSDENSAAAGEEANAALELDRLASNMLRIVSAYRLHHP